jgi:hypothetical protein
MVAAQNSFAKTPEGLGSILASSLLPYGQSDNYFDAIF